MTAADKNMIPTTEQSSGTDDSVALIHVPPIDLFYENADADYITSFSANQLPLVIIDRKLSGEVDPSAAVITVVNDEWEIKYTAAPIIDSKTNVTKHYFAHSSSLIILDSIFEMINVGTCRLDQDGKSFVITFRKNDLRNHLEANNKTRSGAQLNRELAILEGASLTAKNTLPNNDSIRLHGSYLQSAYEINSDDPRLDGQYRATLHPIIARDLQLGRFRDVKRTFLAGSSENNEYYKSLIHRMRWQFTNADAKRECQSYNLWTDDLLFSSGKIDSLSRAAKRSAINSLRKKLHEQGVISTPDNLVSEWIVNPKATDANGKPRLDYRLTITPTIAWGESQLISNAKYKNQLKRIL